MERFSSDDRARQVMWSLAHQLVTQRQYRIVNLFEAGERLYEKLSPGQVETWMNGASEPSELFFVKNHGRKFYLFRLAVVDFVWERQWHDDVERLYQLATMFQQRVVARQLYVQNVLIFPQLMLSGIDHLLPASQVEDRKLVIFHCGIDLTAHEVVGDILEKHGLSKQDLLALMTSAPVGEATLYQLKQEIRQTTAQEERQVQAVFSRGRPFWTFVFLGFNLSVFLLMTFTGGTTNPENLIRYGAKFHPAIWAGEWWRFVTPVFIHIGLAHLLFNSFALYFLGPLVERIYGTGRFFIIYFTAGMMGVAGSFAFSPHLSAGASSAIFGLFGALLYFGQKYRDLFFQTIGMEILTILGINLIFGLFSPGVDNYAHIGGLAGGYLASACLGLPRLRSGVIVRIGALFLYVLLFVWLYQRGFEWM